MHKKFALPLALLAAASSAEAYQSFSSGSYSQVKSENLYSVWDPETGVVEYSRLERDTDIFTLGSRYYFSDRKTLGPLKEFDYIDRISNVYGGYGYTDTEFGSLNYGVFGGEHFVGNLKLGGSIQDIDGEQIYTGSLGYFFTPGLQATVDLLYADGDSHVLFGGQYQHALNGTDYLGFTLQTDEDLSGPMISSRYFRSLGEDRYLALGLQYSDFWFPTSGQILNDPNNAPLRGTWELEGEYYFSTFTSLKAEVGDEGDYRLGASHFFNRNVSMTLGYANESVDYGSTGLEDEMLSLDLSVQF